MTVNLHDQVKTNQRRSLLIILVFFAFVGFLGGMIGVVFGGYFTGNLLDLQYIVFSFIMALLVAGLYIAIFMSQGEKMILSATGAVQADRKNYPYLYHTTEALSLAAGLKVPPKCYVIEDKSLNAYATGFKPENSYIVITTGLYKKLNRQELEGVIAHELSHIKNQDIKVMLMAAGLVGATVLLASIIFRVFIYSFLFGGGGGKKDGRVVLFVFIFWLFLVILSPIVGRMIQLSISRKREYLADSTGALLTRYPEGLASALEKIKNDSNPLGKDKASKATAHLFISSPFKSKKKKTPLFARLFSTHPPIDDRIAKLRGTKK